MTDQKLVVALRWAARGGSIATLLFIGAFFFGEAFSGDANMPTAAEWIAIALFPLGLLVGLTIAWWRELAGGVIALASVAGFYLWNVVVWGDLPSGPFFVLLALPAVLFVIIGLWDAKRPSETSTSTRQGGGSTQATA